MVAYKQVAIVITGNGASLCRAEDNLAQFDSGLSVHIDRGRAVTFTDNEIALYAGNRRIDIGEIVRKSETGLRIEIEERPYRLDIEASANLFRHGLLGHVLVLPA